MIEKTIEKIMVVDDEPTVVRTLKSVLGTVGYKVVCAGCGKECLDLLGRENVDMVFLDMMMPEMNGIDVLKNVKRISPKTYVVMLTAFGTIDTAVDAMKAGAFDYVCKPFKIAEIRNTVLNVLEEIKFKIEHKVDSQFKGAEKNCFEAFKDLITDDVKGFCIASKNPKTINKKYGLKNVTNIYLTEKKEKNCICINPKKIDELKSSIDDFIPENHKVVVLLHNLECLLSQNSLDSVKKLIYFLNEKNIYLILSVDLKEIDTSSLTELENLISDMQVYAISEAISSPLRRKIVSLLGRYDKSSFTKLASALGIKSMPKLSFHLRQLKQKGVVQQDDEKNYFLTSSGKDAVKILKDLEKDKTKTLKNVMWLPMEGV